MHEIGHLVDASFLKGNKPATGENFSGFYDFDSPVGNDDRSSRFFKIAWTSEKERKAQARDLDFVSGYSMTDPFEDFAETYAYYRLHGAEFRKIISSSELLRQKYDFMKWYVFDGKDFGGDEDSKHLNIWQRNYDVTILPYSLKNFLGLTS